MYVCSSFTRLFNKLLRATGRFVGDLFIQINGRAPKRQVIVFHLIEKSHEQKEQQAQQGEHDVNDPQNNGIEGATYIHYA